jgi:cytochrome c553
VCAACHGADGNSAIPANPSLAGQHPEYLYKQLTNFKGKDGKPAERVNGVMAGMVAGLSDQDMRNLAAYYAGQKANGGQAKGSRESIELGQKLWRGGDQSKGLPACAGCHGPAGAGMPAQYPRIAGQHADYTEAQLKTFRVGERANDPAKMMRMIAVKMTDAEIKAVSDYAAGLR